MLERFLKGCAWCLQRILPERNYRMLYYWARLFYDMTILGEKPTAALSGRNIPAPDIDMDMDPGSPGRDAASSVPSGPMAALAEPEGGLIAPEPEGTGCGLVICCAFRGRIELLERVILESLAAESGGDVRWMLAGSTAEDRRFIEAMAARTGRVAGFLCANDPLGRKWQTCVHRSYRHFKADLYGITGSDDLLTARLVDHVLARHAVNNAQSEEFAPDLYAAGEWLVRSQGVGYDPMLLRCSYRYDSIFMPLGAGRFYARKFLDRVDGLLFDSTRQRELDRNGFRLLKARSGLIEYYTVADGPVVSVKGDWEQLNSLDSFFLSNDIDVREYGFRGYPLLRDAMSAETFRQLFGTGPGDLFFD